MQAQNIVSLSILTYTVARQKFEKVLMSSQPLNLGTPNLVICIRLNKWTFDGYELIPKILAKHAFLEEGLMGCFKLSYIIKTP